MGKYDTQLQLITERRAIDAYRRQQHALTEVHPSTVIDYVPAHEVRDQPSANQIIHTQTNHYHHYPQDPALYNPPEKSSAPSDSDTTLFLFGVTGFSLFILGFLFAAVLR